MRELSPPNFAPLLTVIASLSLTLACGDDVTGDGDGASESSGDGDGDGDSEAGDSAEIPDGGPALGIQLTEVEANQGTAILIGKDGAWIGPADRNAFMIRDRDTLIRTQHTVDEGWVPREITGVLHLTDGGGNELPPRVRTFMVEGPSDPKNLSTEFYFSVLADEAQPGLSYWVELLEAGEPPAGGLVEGVSTTPEEGYQLIGYEQTPLEMKVMFVPISYTYITPPTLVVPTEADMQQVQDDLLQNNPLQTVTYELHEPYEYDLQLTNLGQLLSPMSALRANENAEANIYYHALVDVNGPSVNMVAGIAQLTGDGKDSATSRVAATVWWKPQEGVVPAGSSGTIVHEVGHNQGLSHVFCPNAATAAAGPDPNYPHEGGKIGVYGFGIRNFRLYTPTAAHDYMTYCGNAWVSDWTWNKTYRRIRTLTTWDYEGGAAPDSPKVPVLVGTLFPDGSEDWWVIEAPAPDPSSLGADQRIVLASEDGIVDELYANVTRLSDNETLVVTAPLTSSLASASATPLAEITSIARVDVDGEVFPVELSRVHALANGVRVSAK